MKVIIFCGGMGTRLREETEYRPKPMVPIGERPILWHIMKIYAHYGHKDFILCLGYKGDMIRDYFRNYPWHVCDVTLTLGATTHPEFRTHHAEEDWRVTLANTGENSGTACRLKFVRSYVEPDEHFLLTYGDGVGRIDIPAVIAFHHQRGKICTITGVHPPGRFGELSLDETSLCRGFNEKPQAEGGYINGGFMVCDRRIFEYLPDDPTAMLEQDPIKRITRDGQLAVYRHEGFWQPMDTLSEFNLLNRIWKTGEAPWKLWP